MPISPEDVTRLDNYDIMFQTQGWKELVADLKEKLEAIKERGFRATDMRLLAFAQGQYVGYEYITELPKMVEQLRMYPVNDQTDVL
jgi:glycine cleavage system protein P-like pyridoxal-binding family